MRHGKIRSKLGVKADHRVAMLRNLSLGLIEHGRVKTTLPRAKKLRPFLEPIVTRLKDPSVANIRVAVTQLANASAVLDLAQRIAPKFKTRPGGYLRIMKLATPRAGDAADMALVEWVEESLVAAYSDKPKATKTAKGGAKKAAKAAKEGDAEATEKKAAKADKKPAAKKAKETK